MRRPEPCSVRGRARSSHLFTAEFAGATFYFSSEDNQMLFQGDPERYVPAYGGWCAWAASRDSIADIDPKAFVVHDGRLFLNFNGWLNWRFRFNLKGNIEKADIQVSL